MPIVAPVLVSLVASAAPLPACRSAPPARSTTPVEALLSADGTRALITTGSNPTKVSVLQIACAAAFPSQLTGCLVALPTAFSVGGVRTPRVRAPVRCW